jgi:ankyrin repeat protein
MTKSLRTTLPLALLALICVTAVPHRAVADDLDKIKKQLQKMDRQFTPEDFLKAVNEREVKAVKLFLSGGIDIHAHDSSGQTALHLAANNDDAEMISLLLKAGADLNAKDERGKTPLLAAVTNGYGGAKATPPLIAAGADLKTSYQYGTSIIYEAANKDAAAPLQALIKAGAEIEAANEKGETALFLAASMGRKVAPLLIQAGANPNAKNNDGQTVLMAAAEDGELESVRMLLGAKANPNAADRTGNTALIIAAGLTNASMTSFKIDEAAVTKMVELLLGAGADVSAKNKLDATNPLIAAAREGHADAVALLLAAKAPVNAKTAPDGYTALMEAAKAGHGDVVKQLLAAGSDPKLKDRVGRTAASWGADYPDVVTLLGGTATVAKPKPQTGAATVSPEQKEKARQKLEELGYREFNENYFVMSAHNGELEAAQAFLDYGLSVDSKNPDDHVTTPLLAAATLDDPALGLFLIKAGANINAKDGNGSTPLLLAASHCGQTALLKALIKGGADVNAKAAGGATPYMMADVMKCADNLKVLKAAAAKK